MVTESILRAWYEDNASRPFPLDERVYDKATLPYPVLIGLSVGIPSTMMADGTVDGRYTLYVSRVEITPLSVVVEVSAGDAGVVARTVAATADLDAGEMSAAGFALSPVEGVPPAVAGVTGSVYFGPAGVVRSLVGVYEMDAGAGLVDLACVHPYPDSIRAISINGRTLTGDVTFVEGDNISLSFNEEGELVVAHTPPGLDGIHDRAGLVDAIAARFGSPVLTVNGVPPDADGNLAIIPAPGDGDDSSCVDIQATDHGITIANTCAEPCCDKSYLSLLASSLGELNARAARLSAYLESVASNVNSIQNELSILKLGIRQQ